MPEGAVQGMNDFKRVEWGGPCPPPGKVHNYQFKLYALDGTLDLDASAAKPDVENAMAGHILDSLLFHGFLLDHTRNFHIELLFLAEYSFGGITTIGGEPFRGQRVQAL